MAEEERAAFVVRDRRLESRLNRRTGKSALHFLLPLALQGCYFPGHDTAS